MSAHSTLTNYPDTPSRARARLIERRLRAWFQRERRDLPWRRTRDPYAIWVSEVMLQQTQVATVVPFYERFLKALPSVRALAAAPEAAVLRLWEGLGYYRRARSLHQAARIVADSHHGELPRDLDRLRALPGIGRYTAGAILSQAHDQRVPIIEANSARVLCRLFACTSELGSPRVQRWLWATAEALLPAKHTGEFNQALMELGALVCTPRQPDCPTCPLRSDCLAHARGVQNSLPTKPKAVATESIREVAIVIRRGKRVLLGQRPDRGRWAGLWEFPHGSIGPRENPRAAARRLVRECMKVPMRLGEEIGIVRHGITRFAVTMRCFTASARRCLCASRFYTRVAWLHVDKLADYPMSVPQRKVINLLNRL
jgi:A/G-specific adenine glycosylase